MPLYIYFFPESKDSFLLESLVSQHHESIVHFYIYTLEQYPKNNQFQSSFPPSYYRPRFQLILDLYRDPSL